jgi:hypothetical protein
MKTIDQLHGSHLHTYNAIFQHPISHNLEWRQVRTLLAQIGEISDEPNGNLKATRNGQELVLHSPRHKDFADMGEVMKIRHFLEKSEISTT